ATDSERLAAHNGFLLAVHRDGLFDRGLLTVADAGTSLPSPLLTPDLLADLGRPYAVPKPRREAAGHPPYLGYHRQHVAHRGSLRRCAPSSPTAPKADPRPLLWNVG